MFDKSWTLAGGFEFVFKCRCNCPETVKAGLFEAKTEQLTGITFGFKIISLCPAFFKESPESQIGIVMHELSHVHAGTSDKGYWVDDQWITPRGNPTKLDPSDLVINADSYEELIQEWLEIRGKRNEKKKKKCKFT